VDLLDGERGGLPFGLTGGNLLNLVEILVLVGAALFAVRMLRPKVDEEAERQLALSAAQAEQIALEGRAAEGDPEAIQMLEAQDEFPQLDQEIALAQVDGRIRLSALRKIGDAIAASPAESASVIRQWMNA
jgi:flagellar M-ring protein FliF